METGEKVLAGAVVLVAEDETAIREGLAALLDSEGLVVVTAADGVEALARFRARRPNLVLLDVMMPKLNGYCVCTEIRKQDADVPILFLTAKDGEAEELRGLACGADDYVSKTASEQILLARIANVLKRSGPRTGNSLCPRSRDMLRTGSEDSPLPEGDCPRPDGFGFAGWHVDTARFRLVSAMGDGPELTLREIALLHFFAHHPGEVFSRDFLVTRFWGLDFDGDEATLSTAMFRLRRKLGAEGTLIEAVYGRGYRYNGTSACGEAPEQ